MDIARALAQWCNSGEFGTDVDLSMDEAIQKRAGAGEAGDLVVGKIGPELRGPPGQYSQAESQAAICFAIGTTLISTLRGSAATATGAVISSIPF